MTEQNKIKNFYSWPWVSITVLVLAIIIAASIHQESDLEVVGVFKFFILPFVHGSTGHLFHNLLAFAILGIFVERKIGHKHYLAAFLFLAYFAEASTYFDDKPGIGLSGVIAGLTILTLVTSVLFVKHISLEKKPQLEGWNLFWNFFPAAIALVSIWYLLTNTQEGVSNIGHLAGFAGGILAIGYVKLKIPLSL